MRRGLLVSVLASCAVCFGAFAAVLGAGWSPHLGLDLQGGLQVVYQPVRSATQGELNTIVSIMQQRANGLGLANPNIGTQGNTVVVQLPGIKNPQQALKVIGSTAQLYFRPVLCTTGPYLGSSKSAKATTPKGAAADGYVPPGACSTQSLYSSAYYNSATGQFNAPAPDAALEVYPTTTSLQDTASRTVLICGNTACTLRYELGPPQVDSATNISASGEILASATPQLSQTQGWVVNFTIKSQYSAFFDQVAKQNYHVPLAIDLGAYVVSAPTIETTSFGGSGEINGNFTQQSANNLALVLRYGSLPVALKQQTATTISPSLGKQSLHAGLLAGLLGLLLVMGYMIVYYRALGIVVVLGLITTGCLLYSIISLLGQTSSGLTLDLSGMTGLIVSVGITVDSYVVYFERLKDEVRAGRSVRSSVDRGFKSAYRTILSADAISFLGALVLWLLSIGAVRGFAFMLGLSTLVDVLSAYVFTRPFVILLGRNRIFTEARGLGVARGLAAPSEAAA